MTFDALSPVQKQIDHYRQRVAATQSAIVALCDKSLDDKSAIIRLNSLCDFMVTYRERLNYWLAQENVLYGKENIVVTPKPTVDDCKKALNEASIIYSEIYPCKFSPAIAQIEMYGGLKWQLAKLRLYGFECEGEQDYMDDLPYCLIQITALPKAGV